MGFTRAAAPLRSERAASNEDEELLALIRALFLLAIGLAGCSDGSIARADDIAAGQPGGFRCSVVAITDGDTLRCNETEADGRQIRVRLSGIAARERDGSCSPGHPCPAATAEAATTALEDLVAGEVLICTDEARTFGRRAAFCRRLRDGADISCAMVKGGFAARWDRHWGNHQCDR